MSNIDEENQLSQVSTAGQSSSASQSAKGPVSPYPPHGYCALAEMMTELPTTCMYRRFGVLNSLSILFYQAELMKLEHEFLEQVRSDIKSGDPVKRAFNTDWDAMSATEAQREIITRIRTVLEKYNAQMLLQHQLVNLEDPAKADVKFLRDWMRRSSLGDIQLNGADKDVWMKTNLSDFVAVDARRPDDALTRWITKTILEKYDSVIGRHLPNQKTNHECFKGSTVYSDKFATRTVSVIVMGLSSVFPISSILLLNHFEAKRTRMIILCVYTLVFSMILAAISGVKRIEVFSAAAAFAAVQVVFISQNS